MGVLLSSFFARPANWAEGIWGESIVFFSSSGSVIILFFSSDVWKN